MPLNIEKKRICQAIVNVFETGVPSGNYGALAVLRDGAGFSYGRSQSTDGGDVLDEICFQYGNAKGAWSTVVAKHIERLVCDGTISLAPWTAGSYPASWPAWAIELADALRKAGTDPAMIAVQDRVFDERYWIPAAKQCDEMKLVLPLSWAAVYDTAIQSGPGRIWSMRALFPQSPPSKGGSEKIWAQAYVTARHQWIAGFTGKDAAHTAAVRSTTYRMDAFDAFIAAGNWQLDTPLQIARPKATIT